MTVNRSVRVFDTIGDTSADALFPAAVRAGEFVYVSGQASVDDTGAIVPGTFAEEMDRSIDNLRRVLAAARLTLADVIKVNAYVDDPEDLEEYNRLYPLYFHPPRPARTTLTSCFGGRLKFEIDAVAYAQMLDPPASTPRRSGDR